MSTSLLYHGFGIRGYREFGRTPKINATAGRDHYPRVYSAALAGGGFKRGLVYGSSNSTASEPEENPVRIEDVLTTVYHQIRLHNGNCGSTIIVCSTSSNRMT